MIRPAVPSASSRSGTPDERRAGPEGPGSQAASTPAAPASAAPTSNERRVVIPRGHREAPTGSRHNFPEIVASGPPGDHNLPEVVPIIRPLPIMGPIMGTSDHRAVSPVRRHRQAGTGGGPLDDAKRNAEN